MLRGLVSFTQPDLILLVTTLEPDQNQSLLLGKLRAAQHSQQDPVQVEMSEEDLETMSDLLPPPSSADSQAISTRKTISTALQQLRHL